MSNEITMEGLTDLLSKFKTDVSAVIEEKAKQQTATSDAVNKEVAALKEKLAAAETALEEIKKQNKKSFGLPGVEGEKDRFSWGKYFGGLYRNFLLSKGQMDRGEVEKYWDTTASFENTVCKDYSAASGASGGFIVPPQIYQGDIVDTIYANTAIMKLPVMKLPNLTSDLPIPLDLGNLTAYSLGEVEAPTKTSSDFGLAWLREKKIGVYSRISNRLLNQTNNAVEGIVRGKMARDGAVKLSACLTNGTGSDSEGKGISQYYSAMTDVSNLSTNGRRFTIDDLADMKMSLAAADELNDGNSYGTLLRPEVLYGMIREKTEMYSGQASRNGAPKVPGLLIDKTVIESALKLSIQDTTQMAKGTVGTSTTCSKVITGDWSKFIFATFRDPIFKVSDQASDSTTSAFLTDQVFLVMFFSYDCVCTRPTAFCGRNGAETAKANW